MASSVVKKQFFRTLFDPRAASRKRCSKFDSENVVTVLFASKDQVLPSIQKNLAEFKKSQRLPNPQKPFVPPASVIVIETPKNVKV